MKINKHTKKVMQTENFENKTQDLYKRVVVLIIKNKIIRIRLKPRKASRKICLII